MFVKKFLTILFNTFLLVVLFVNLIQFAKVPMIDFDVYSQAPIMTTEYIQNSHFGFSSLIKMFTDFNNTSYVKNIMDQLTRTFNSLGKLLLMDIPSDIVHQNWWSLGFTLLTGGLNKIYFVFSNIVRLVYCFAGLANGFIEVIALAFGGAYNVPNNSDLLSSYYQYWITEIPPIDITETWEWSFGSFEFIKVLVR